MIMQMASVDENTGFSLYSLELLLTSWFCIKNKFLDYFRKNIEDVPTVRNICFFAYDFMFAYIINDSFSIINRFNQLLIHVKICIL